MCENLRIRNYVMEIIYDNPNRPMCLLSTRLLAEKFGVSRTTVMTALAALKSEGYLLSRPGKGVYTNPESRFEDIAPKRLPLAGVIVNYGRNFYHSRREWALLSAVGNGLLDAGFNFREIRVDGLSEEAVFEELAESYVSGLLWLLVSDEVTEKLLLRVRGELFPLLTCTDGFSHPADFREIRNFRLEDYPSPDAVARAMVDDLKAQMNPEEKQT